MDGIGTLQTKGNVSNKHNQFRDYKTLRIQVYKKLLEVPSGKITTYGDLAKAVGLQNGQRIIGKIMNQNPYPSLVPCHRVIMSDGKLGGYAYGQEIKKNMLANEGIKIFNGKISNLKNKRYVF